MTLISSLLNIYNSSVPFLQTDLNTFEKRLDLKGDSTCFIEEMDGIPVGFTVVNQNGILALCVLPQYRNKGIGTKLLHKAENQIKKQGYKHIVLGLSNKTYLCQGIPYNNDYNPCDFFKKHGYSASWSSIDMVLPLDEFSLEKIQIPSAPDSVIFRYAQKEDHESLQASVAKVDPSWCRYFDISKDPIYLAVEDGQIVGFVILVLDDLPFSINFNGRVGGLGCLGVIPEKRARGVGLQLAARATHELKQKGYHYSYLGYTWLEDWYGSLGYKTYARFWMGEKKIEP